MSRYESLLIFTFLFTQPVLCVDTKHSTEPATAETDAKAATDGATNANPQDAALSDEAKAARKKVLVETTRALVEEQMKVLETFPEESDPEARSKAVEAFQKLLEGMTEEERQAAEETFYSDLQSKLKALQEKTFEEMSTIKPNENPSKEKDKKYNAAVARHNFLTSQEKRLASANKDKTSVTEFFTPKKSLTATVSSSVGQAVTAVLESPVVEQGIKTIRSAAAATSALAGAAEAQVQAAQANARAEQAAAKARTAIASLTDTVGALPFIQRTQATSTLSPEGAKIKTTNGGEFQMFTAPNGQKIYAATNDFGRAYIDGKPGQGKLSKLNGIPVYRDTASATAAIGVGSPSSTSSAKGSTSGGVRSSTTTAERGTSSAASARVATKVTSPATPTNFATAVAGKTFNPVTGNVVAVNGVPLPDSVKTEKAAGREVGYVLVPETNSRVWVSKNGDDQKYLGSTPLSSGATLASSNTSAGRESAVRELLKQNHFEAAPQNKGELTYCGGGVCQPVEGVKLSDLLGENVSQEKIERLNQMMTRTGGATGIQVRSLASRLQPGLSQSDFTQLEVPASLPVYSAPAIPAAVTSAAIPISRVPSSTTSGTSSFQSGPPGPGYFWCPKCNGGQGGWLPRR